MIHPEQVRTFEALMKAWKDGDNSIIPVAYDLLCEMGLPEEAEWHFGKHSECYSSNCVFCIGVSCYQTFLEERSDPISREACLQSVRGRASRKNRVIHDTP